MKLIPLIMLFILSSCASHSVMNFRHPSSKERIVLLDPEALQLEDFEGSDFLNVLMEAQLQGFEQLIFGPQTDPHIKVSSVDANYVSGDVFFFVGLNFSKKDEFIRKGEYDGIYAAIRRLSALKFRVTVNLTASISDLKSALENKRPTIIFWSSHGDENAFYDFNQVPVPFDIFQSTSRSVYQFHLASCYGFKALQANYLKSKPAIFRYWGWSDPTRVFNTKNHFLDPQWTPFLGYPTEMVNNNLSCKEAHGSYVMKFYRGKNELQEMSFPSQESCFSSVVNSSPDYVCKPNTQKTWDMHNLKLNATMPGDGFDTAADCFSRITNIYNKKVCRKIVEDKKFHAVDTQNRVSPESFGSLSSCYAFIYNSKDT